MTHNELFVHRANKKLDQMKRCLAEGPQSLFTDQLVTLWKICWAFQGDEMRRSYGDHFEEIGRRANHRCLECGEETEYNYEFCEHCDQKLKDIIQQTTEIPEEYDFRSYE